MLTLLTMNINGYGNSCGSWEGRRGLIANLLRDLGPDVVALQCVQQNPQVERGMDQAEQLCQILQGEYQSSYSPLTRLSDGTVEGSAFLSRHSWKRVASMPLKRARGSEDYAQRSLLSAEMEVNGVQLQVLNCHFSWIEEEFARNLDQAVERMRSTACHRLVTGDFNAEPTNPNLERLREIGLVDLWQQLQIDDPGFTYHTRELSKRIDYIWADSVLADSTVAVDRIYSLQEKEYFHSDHAALLSIFEI